MTDAGSNNKRIAKNTLMLYTRQILILLVSLYTVRVVLDVLGVEDYGIYNVIGGIVMLFSFLSGTMASATQRFFSFALGKNDIETLKKIFSVNLIIYITIAITAVVFLESIGMWYVKEQLKIPAERYDAVIILFHFSIFTFIGTMLAAPFMAIIIAHEDMQIYAYVSIVEVLLKLGVVFSLMYVSFDKLVLYGILLMVVSVINLLLYIAICLKKYQECQFRKFYWDKILLHEIVGFTGWSLFGSFTSILRTQAVTILLNQVFTPVVVAARAISTQISNQVNIFSANFNVGIYPPIIKSYSANKMENMFSLIFNGAKITFFLMWVFALPLFIEMDTILQLWLKALPEGTVLFSRLALIEVLINSISMPITTAARAPGKVRTYELTLGCLQISIFFIDWIILKLGNAAYSVFIVAIIVNLVMFFIRLKIVNKLIGLPLLPFFKNVVIPVLLVIFTSTAISFAIFSILPQGIFYSGISIILSMASSSICMYYIGLNKIWREKVKEMIQEKIKEIVVEKVKMIIR
ncbi:oligosaccharide flippase family protein [Mangrovibacterium marinum]|uniref:lipopolysaccharide biosynthesis protein n=1 Tax=Mangrovibacterium marinum TaxID=1639118 RepID=UPI002A18D474|nr:oligosaccharide flippase family protein [Mangrovibacterium marinum]